MGDPGLGGQSEGRLHPAQALCLRPLLPGTLVQATLCTSGFMAFLRGRGGPPLGGKVAGLVGLAWFLGSQSTPTCPGLLRSQPRGRSGPLRTRQCLHAQGLSRQVAGSPPPLQTDWQWEGAAL